MLDVSRILGICFDIDGTLSDTDDEFVRILNSWLAPIVILFPDWDSMAFSRRVVMASETPATFLHILPDRMGIDGRISRIGDYINRKRILRSARQFSLIPGVEEMLHELCSHYALSIVSSRSKTSVQNFLNQFNLGNYFTSIVTSQTSARVKPHPDPIRWAAREMNIAPNQCLMVGDTTVDILAGRRAGSQTVGVLCGFGEEKELSGAGADLILETTPDLVRYLL